MSRGSNVLHVVPHDWSAAADFLGPALDRLDDSSPQLQMLALTSDAESAVALIRAVRQIRGDSLTLMAATSAGRGKRLLQRGQPQVVAGTPEEVLQLIQGAAIKLDALRAVVIAWADDLIATDAAPLENILAELPRETARVIVASDTTPEVEQLVERYARRARRTGDTASEGPPVDVEYVATAAEVRPAALRRLLDALDPSSAVVVVQSPAALLDTRGILADLGHGDDPAVRVVESVPPEEGAGLVIFYGLPRDAAALARAGSGGGRIVVIVQPRQLQSLRRMSGGRLTPLALPETAQWARRRDEVVRDELREEIGRGQLWREMVALEPMLAEHDALEIAAAALRMLEQSRRSARPQEGTGRRAEGAGMGRLFVNVGSRDGVRPADIVGALANEVGISRDAIGKIDMRESFALVEIDPSIITGVPAKLTGVAIRGRRVIARLDQQERTPARGSGGGRDREPRRPSGDRDDRRSPRGDRDERRPARHDRDDRGGRERRPPRSAGGSDTRRSPRSGAGRSDGPRSRAGSGRPPRRPE